MNRKAAKAFSPGDRVAYAAAFLKSTGQRTGWAPFARGTVTGGQTFGGRVLVSIKWDDVADEKNVLDCNLTLVSRIAVDAALAN
jgi:hypothetical protein